MKDTNRFTKNLNKSHLTEHEKRHTMALAFLGVLLIVSGIGMGWWLHVLSIGMIVTCLFFMAGTWCIAFPWGYIGATEDERSGS